jgi:hypothetical protein
MEMETLVSYIDDHPTTFSWNQDVGAVVARLQAAYPWKTYINTYVNHPPLNPPLIPRDYQTQSFDVWGGGRRRGVYRGYRGKPLRKRLGRRIFKELFAGKYGGPGIAWIIYEGRMWVSGSGFEPAPPGAADSDPGHFSHIHVTYVPF